MRLLFAAATIFSFGSCYYESSEPLSPPKSARLDVHIIGAWEAVSEKEHDIARIHAFDDHSYVIEWADHKGERELVRAHVTEIARTRFLNVQKIGDASPYVFFRYDWAGDTLVLRGLKDSAPPPLASPAILRRWLSEREMNTAIYDDAVRLVRK